MTQAVLEPTTAATQSDTFVVTKSDVPATVFADNLASSEEARVQVHVNGSWINVTGIDGDDWTLQASGSGQTTAVRIDTPGTFRVDKDATAGACGIYVALNDNV